MRPEEKARIRAVLAGARSTDAETYTRSHAVISRKAVEWLENLLNEDVRPEVYWFAEKMEAKLRANDHKRHWSACEQEYLYNRLEQEMRELQEALKRRIFEGGTAEDVIQEAADVANFAMMIAHKCDPRAPVSSRFSDAAPDTYSASGSMESESRRCPG